jgi:mycothiol synthase
MNLKYIKISEDEYDLVKDMLLQDKGTSEDLWWAVETEPETLTLAYLDEKLVGLIQLTPEKDTSSIVVFVAPEYRRKGIGHLLVMYGENILSEILPKEIMTNYLADNDNSIAFARKCGYERFFSSSCMKYEGARFDIDELSIRQYCDDDYSQSQRLYAEAFHKMRVSVGDFPDSEIQRPSEQNRKAWEDDSENRYCYVLNNEIVAHAHLDNNEISALSVRIDMQGSGIGRNFMKYLCNEIFNRGHNEVILWCVVGNKARHLYNSLGFKELYTSEYAHKYNN